MGYLFIQTLLWILLAFLLGLILGWLLRGIICGSSCKDKEGASDSSSGSASSDGGGSNTQAVASTASAAAATSAAKPKAAASAAPAQKATNVSDDMKPQGLSAPTGGVADDLKRIKGVGPVIEKTLNDLGVYHFTQVADFTENNIKWVDNFISFPGRIKREGWVSQAGDLAKGAQTEFAARYDKGEVGEDNPNT